MIDNYIVYWIHLPIHIDPYKDGYIGITNNLENRIKSHKKAYKNKISIVSNAFDKYDNLLVEVLYDSISSEEAKNIEMKYRPSREIGWNIAVGGGLPPNRKGIKRPEHSKQMSGHNNPFYGKNHSVEVRQVLSERKRGYNNHFYGKKRPEHSERMKLKTGELYPKFKGWFITPHGKFSSFCEASEKTGIKISSIYNYCIHNNDKVITKLSISKSKFLSNLDVCPLGKTYRELGFGFEEVKHV